MAFKISLQLITTQIFESSRLTRNNFNHMILADLLCSLIVPEVTLSNRIIVLLLIPNAPLSLRRTMLLKLIEMMNIDSFCCLKVQVQGNIMIDKIQQIQPLQFN